MKLKSILSLVLVLSTFAAIAQPGNLRRAKANYNRFVDVKSVGNPGLGLRDLENAQNALEKAIEHNRTSSLSETWVYYALVKAELAVMDSTRIGKKHFNDALEAREKALELDKDNAEVQNLERLSTLLAQYSLNEGVRAWDRQDFKDAYNSFSQGTEYLPKDTTLLYYAGLAAVNSQEYEKALEKYVQLAPIEDFSSNDQIILDISRLYLMEGDTTNAIKYADEGRAKYPENGDLARQYIELNLMAGNEEQVITAITEQARREPKNKTLQYYLGIAYSAIDDMDNAEKAYLQALEIDSNYADAHINLGGLLLNRGIDHWNKIHNNRELTQKQYDTEIKNAHAIFDQALPHLEKAVSINPENRIGLINLHKYYQIKENEEKAKEIEAKISALSK